MGKNRYKCLIFDHDDTVVDSTASIHQPAFQAYLDIYRPGRTCSVDEYMRKNCDPGFLEMCYQEYGMTDEELEEETVFWQNYVKNHIPTAYAGMKEIMERQLKQGGHICVVTHSFEATVRRDYEANHLPQPELVFGWEQPKERRKPSVWPVEEIARRLGLEREEMLMLDDLRPGYEMAKAAGIDFAAARWANDIPQIDGFMQSMCGRIFKTVEQLSEAVFID